MIIYVRNKHSDEIIHNGIEVTDVICGTDTEDDRTILILPNEQHIVLTPASDYLIYCDLDAPKTPFTFEQLVHQKLSEISATCQAAIHAGFDLETENGTEHFSLTAEDQINIQNLMMQVASGALAVPYHADNTPCRMFSAGEIMAVAEGAVRHKTYHTTYCNHLNVWIRRCTDAQELQDITYGTELPEDLAANMAALLGGADA